MNRATRTSSIPTVVRRTGGLATKLTVGALLCGGLMGMSAIMPPASSATDLRYVDTRSADMRGTGLLAVVETEAIELEIADETSRLPKLTPPPRQQARASRPAAAPAVGLRAAPAREARVELAAATATKVAAVAASKVVANDDDDLSPEMAKVRDWVAERYRVSEKSLEPALAAAEASATKLGFDPLLIVAIMAVESSFNPRAVSNMGAQGLMQVIPRYHQDKIGKNKSKYALFDPELNVRVGAEVLHEGLRRYGSMQRALQYYNGSLRDPNARYTRKVMSIKKHLLTAAGRGPMATRVTLTPAG